MNALRAAYASLKLQIIIVIDDMRVNEIMIMRYAMDLNE